MVEKIKKRGETGNERRKGRQKKRARRGLWLFQDIGRANTNSAYELEQVMSHLCTSSVKGRV